MNKIMFNDRYGLTEAVLEGWKTMTRRIIGEIPPIKINGALKPVETMYIEAGKLVLCCGDTLLYAPNYLQPKYKVGDFVAVAENYKTLYQKGKLPVHNCADLESFTEMIAWSNKMYVRSDLMPARIQITGLRAERIQDISNEDCMREGVRKLESENCPTMFTFYGWSFKNKVNRCTDSPKEAFGALFKKLSGKKAWDDNPWVFVYEFELVKEVIKKIESL